MIIILIIIIRGNLKGGMEAKSGKASDVCGIQGEALKAGGEVVVKWLQVIYNIVRRTDVTPSNWRSAIIVPIHKKGSRKKCKNYRGMLDRVMLREYSVPACSPMM